MVFIESFIDLLLWFVCPLIIGAFLGFIFFNVKFDERWITYSLFLLISLVISIFAIKLLLSPDANFSETDEENARYLISSLIQSEAAIIAIVITLSLVAIQQTSSTYSTRVIDIFTNPKRNPYFFLLILSYILCIVFSTFLLKVINKSHTVETSIWFAIFSFVFLLFFLIPYILKTLSMLRPTTLITLLSKNILLKSIKSAIELEKSNNIDLKGKITPINDTIQPIIDVVQGSMKSYDYETVRYGLRNITEKTIKILKEENDDTSKDEISNRIIDHIKSIGIFANKQEMDRSVNDVVSSFQSIFDYLIEDERNKTENTPISKPMDALLHVIFDIGRQNIDENHKNSFVHISKVLSEIAIKSIAVDSRKITFQVVDILGRLTFDRIEIENNSSVYKTIVSGISFDAIEHLEKIGEKTAEKGWDLETRTLIYWIKLIVETLINNTEIKGNAEYLLRNLLCILLSFSLSLIRNNLISLVYKTVSIMYLIGKKSVHKNEEITRESRELLAELIREIWVDCKEANKDTNLRLSEHITKLLDEINTLQDNASKQS